MIRQGTRRFLLLAAWLWLSGLPSAFARQALPSLPDPEWSNPADYASTTSPLKNRVGGAAAWSSGRFSNYDPESPEIATGSNGCEYESASGRRKWLNRDPLGEEESINLYGFCGNDPIDNLDPDGLSWVGKITPKIIKLIKGRRAAKATSVEEAVRLYKEGEDFVMCPSRGVAKKAAQQAGGGHPPLHEIDKKTGAPHYHPVDRSGHFLYSLAGALTLSHYAEGHGGFFEGAAFVGDLVNPLSLPQDILDIKDAIFQ